MNRPRTPRFLIPFMLAVLAIFALAAPTAALAREADVGGVLLHPAVRAGEGDLRPAARAGG